MTVDLVYTKAFWKHLDTCGACNSDKLCARGSELLEARNEEIAEAMCPMPTSLQAKGRA